MSVKAIEQSPYMTPDSLRQFLKMNKSMYDLHTKKNYGLTDTGGIEYAGTMENFGSEILIESNKLRLNRPPIQCLNISSDIQFYFDLKFYDELYTESEAYVYSNNDRYFQQNMVCGLLKEDRLINGYTYQIIMNDIKLVYRLCSHSTSDSEVKRTAFFETTTPPVLRINDGTNTTDVNLVVDDGSEVDTIYYFPINLSTWDLLGIQYPADSYINIIASVGTFTINVNDYKFQQIPMIWFCVDRFRLLPELIMYNNTSYNNQSLLLPGLDGNNIMHLYPYAGASPCLPYNVLDEEDGKVWYIKAYGDFSKSMSESHALDVLSGKITKIDFVYSRFPWIEPDYSKSITYESTYCKIKLNNPNIWYYKYPEPDEYDYTGDGEYPIGYAYIRLSEFYDNDQSVSLINDQFVMKPAFDASFDSLKYISYFEQKMNHGVSGLHVKYGPDKSENGIPDKRGCIHDLGQFDGLPNYYKTWDNSVSRAHVELYSIRDSIVKNNSNPMNKQTAALIVDSGFPQTRINDVKTGVISIAYKGINETLSTAMFEYERVDGEITGNWISDIGYHSDDEFGYTGMNLYMFDSKWVYHGNGIFSLGMQGFDPDTEIGRVFAITNDSIKYTNNAYGNKAARTLAMICDIPTSFLQLIDIPNVSPIYTLDPYYTRMFSTWNVEKERLLWNVRHDNFVTYNDQRVFDSNDDLNAIISQQYMRDHYSMKTDFNQTLDMSHPSTATSYTFSVYDSGSGYQDGDHIDIILGGIKFNAIVNIVSDTTTISVQDRDNTFVNVGNIPYRETQLRTQALGSSMGVGLIVLLTIDQTVWDNLHIQNGNVNDDVYALKFDDDHDLWCWRFTGTTWVKDHILVGESYIANMYSAELSDNLYSIYISRTGVIKTKVDTTVKDVMLYNNFITGFDGDSAAPRTDTTPNPNHINYDETFYMGEIMYHTSRAVDTVESEFDDDRKYYDRKMLPEHHWVNSYYASTPICKLTFEDYIQPNVYMYTPIKTNTFVGKNYVFNEFIIENKKEYTFGYMTDIHSEYTDTPIYSFTFANDISDSWEQQIASLRMMSVDQLLDRIKLMDETADPVIYQGTTSAYTKDQLVHYICERWYIERQDSKKILNVNGRLDSIKIGGYTQIHNAYDGTLTTINGTELDSDPTSIYQIDFNTDISTLDGFRMYDELGNDVSRYCILLINNQLYAFSNEIWVKIKTGKDDD